MRCSLTRKKNIRFGMDLEKQVPGFQALEPAFGKKGRFMPVWGKWLPVCLVLLLAA